MAINPNADSQIPFDYSGSNPSPVPVSPVARQKAIVYETLAKSEIAQLEATLAKLSNPSQPDIPPPNDGKVTSLGDWMQGLIGNKRLDIISFAKNIEISKQVLDKMEQEIEAERTKGIKERLDQLKHVLDICHKKLSGEKLTPEERQEIKDFFRQNKSDDQHGVRYIMAHSEKPIQRMAVLAEAMILKELVLLNKAAEELEKKAESRAEGGVHHLEQPAQPSIEGTATINPARWGDNSSVQQ